jgi:hypothetical protein
MQMTAPIKILPTTFVVALLFVILSSTFFGACTASTQTSSVVLMGKPSKVHQTILANG